jgi:N-acetylneuraminic acid mutarotase
MTRILALGVLCVLSGSACSSDEKAVTEGGSSGSGGSAGASGGGAAAGSGGAASGASGSSSGSAGSTSGAGGSSAGSAGSASGSAGVAGVSGGAGSAAGGSSAGSAGTAGTSGNAGSAGTGANEGGAGGDGNVELGTPAEDALPELDAVRQEHSVAALRGEVYVIGGYTPMITSSVLAYDPATMTFREVADFPEPFNHPNVGVVGDTLIVAGYYINGMTTPTDEVWAYDPDEDAWTERTPMPADTERGAACTAVLDGKIYVFGGARAGSSSALVSAYDVADDSWEQLPDMPVRREHCAAGAIGGKLYIAGGRADGIEGLDTTAFEFDPASPAYVPIATMPTPRGGVASVVLAGRLFVFGGEGSDDDPNGVFPDVEAYDPVADAWEVFPAMDAPRHGFGAAVLDGRIYLMGGATRQGGGADTLSSVYYFEP